MSQNGSTNIYYYSSPNQTVQPAIRELVITGNPGSVNNQEAYNLSSPLVASPDLATNQTGEVSLYRPLAVSNNAVPSLPGRIYVFYTDKITGDPVDSMSLSGFSEMLEISRPVVNTSWPSTGQIPIPLGDKNSPPNQKRAYQRRKTYDWGSWLRRE